MNATPPAIELRPVTSLKPYANNARRHSRRQIRQIAESIRRFGFTNFSQFIKAMAAFLPPCSSQATTPPKPVI
jgi:hypothetical protein